jgi:hypothetical protein
MHVEQRAIGIEHEDGRRHGGTPAVATANVARNNGGRVEARPRSLQSLSAIVFVSDAGRRHLIACSYISAT